MSIASLIRAMADAGATPEAIALAVEAVEEAQNVVAKQREAARDRKRRQRANETQEGVTVTGQSRDKAETVTAEAPRPLPPSPQTPQPPTPSPGEQSRARKGRSASEAYPADFEAAWKAYPHTEGRSSKTDTMAQWRKLADETRAALPDACLRYRREGREPKAECGAPAMERWLRRGLHQHWIGKAAPAADDGPTNPTVQARRLRHWRDTGAWEPGWGPRPAAANDTPAPLAQDTAA